MQSRFDTEARIAVAQAADIARELGHTEVGPDHLLLGLLANARGTAYAALTDHGLRLDAAREIVADQHVDPVDEPEPPTPTATATPTPRPRRTTRTARPCAPSASTSTASVTRSAPTSARTSPTAGPRGPSAVGRRGRGRAATTLTTTTTRAAAVVAPAAAAAEGPRFSRELRGLLRDVRRSVLRDRFDDDRDSRQEVPGMSGARLLVALTRSENPVVQAVLADATDLDALRAQAEAAVTPSAV